MRRFFDFAGRHFLFLLRVLLLSAGAVIPILSMLSLPVDCPFILLLCTGFALIYTLLPGKLKGLYYPLALAAMAAAVLRHRTEAEAFQEAIAKALACDFSLFMPFAGVLTLLLCIFFVSCAIAVCDSSPLFYAGMLCVLAASGLTLCGIPAMPAMLPLLAALPLCACREDTGLLHSIAVSVCAALLAVCFLPMAGTKVPEFEEGLRDAWDYIREHFFYTEARMPFSLSQLGWEPLGRPGGTVSPTDEPVFWAQVSGPVLLRGVVHSEYDGHSFSDPQPGERYQMDDLRFSSLRGTLFDRSLPAGVLSAALPAAEDIAVHLLTASTSTLWLTQRFDGLTAPGLTLYHSGTGEVFATRSLTADDSYAFRGIRMTSDTAGIRELALAAEAAQGARQEDDPRFTALPEAVEAEVVSLARQLTAGTDSSFDRAAALCAWLKSSYPYSLVQNQPPEDRDFVSWFLLTEKRGCCTSFAAAMVVMARAVSLPARYVEGFSLQPDADGIAVATGKQAHAWAEVYLPGFGWLAFDATPGGEDGSESTVGAENEPSPAPSSSAAPEPTPTSSAASSRTPTPEPEATLSPEETPLPGSAPSPVPTPAPEEAPESRLPFVLPIVLLALLSAAGLRLWVTDPRFLLRHHTAGGTVLIAYRLCVRILGCMGIAQRPDESPAAFLARAEKVLGGSPGLAAFADCVTRARYSGRKPSSGDAALARRTVRLLLYRMSLRQRIRWILSRFFQRTVHLTD